MPEEEAACPGELPLVEGAGENRELNLRKGGSQQLSAPNQAAKAQNHHRPADDGEDRGPVPAH